MQFRTLRGGITAQQRVTDEQEKRGHAHLHDAHFRHINATG